MPAWLLAIGKGIAWGWGKLLGLPWKFWAVVAVLLAAWWWGNTREAAGRAEAEAACTADKVAFDAKLQAEREQAAKEARQREAEHRAALDAVADRHAQEMRDAEATADAVAADLRAGALRLRQHWQGCEAAAARVPATPAAPAGPDAGAELRAAGARDLVRAAAECDATIRGLQSVIREGLGQEGE